jgi:hypothetical protein
MGNKARSRLAPKNVVRMGDALFSKTQQRVLSYLFGHPLRSYYVNEVGLYNENLCDLVKVD